MYFILLVDQHLMALAVHPTVTSPGDLEMAWLIGLRNLCWANFTAFFSCLLLGPRLRVHRLFPTGIGWY